MNPHIAVEGHGTTAHGAARVTVKEGFGVYDGDSWCTWFAFPFFEFEHGVWVGWRWGIHACWDLSDYLVNELCFYWDTLLLNCVVTALQQKGWGL